MSEIEDRLRLARAALVSTRRFPYYYPLAFGLQFIADSTVGTMAIDQRLRLYYSPEWVAERTDKELMGLLWHELNHVLRGHTAEQGRHLEKWVASALRDPDNASLRELAETWFKDTDQEADASLLQAIARRLTNVAMDIEINDDAEEAAVTLPEGGQFPETYAFPAGLTAEKYAELLLERIRLRDGSGGDDWLHALEVASEDARYDESSCDGDGGVDPSMTEVLKRQTAEEIVKAAEKNQGSVPAGLLRAAQAILTPKVNWRSVLRQALRKGIMDFSDRSYPSYARPHRRAGALGRIVLPGGYTLKPKIAVVIDTSGSVSNRMLSQALAEVKALLRSVKPTVYSVDAEVHTAQRVLSAEQIKLLGGGGTDMGRGIEAAVKDGHDLIVVLTDGYTPWPDKPPKAKVIVGLLGEDPDRESVPRWAKTIVIDD